jgi:hypothetical protein
MDIFRIRIHDPDIVYIILNRDSELHYRNHGLLNRDLRLHYRDHGLLNRDDLRLHYRDQGLLNRYFRLHYRDHGLLNRDLRLHYRDHGWLYRDCRLYFYEDCPFSDSVLHVQSTTEYIVFHTNKTQRLLNTHSHKIIK